MKLSLQTAASFFTRCFVPSFALLRIDVRVLMKDDCSSSDGHEVQLFSTCTMFWVDTSELYF